MFTAGTFVTDTRFTQRAIPGIIKPPIYQKSACHPSGIHQILIRCFTIRLFTMLPSANAAPPSMMYHPAVHHPTHAVYSLFASIAVFMSTHAPATCHTPTTWRTGMCGMPCTIRHRCSRNRLASESSRDRHPNHRGIATRITVGSPPESQQTYVRHNELID